jgi:phenylpyruvate tautomerase PptA (4-oxalocrotonate tautomerase family)
MPFVQINLSQNLTDKVRKDISLSIHESLVNIFKIPQDDYFQVIHEIRPTDLLYPESYMGIPHTNNLVYIQIIAKAGRTADMKKELYRSIAEKIAQRTPININDVIIVLVENLAENWSFGQGLAQLA